MVSDFEYVSNSSDSNISGDQIEAQDKPVSFTELSFEISTIGISTSELPEPVNDPTPKDPASTVEVSNPPVLVSDSGLNEPSGEPGKNQADSDDFNPKPHGKTAKVSRPLRGERNHVYGILSRLKAIDVSAAAFLTPFLALWFSLKTLQYTRILPTDNIAYILSSVSLKLFTTEASDLIFELMGISILGVMVFCLTLAGERVYSNYKRRTPHYRMGTYVIYTECDCHQYGFANMEADANHRRWKNSDEFNHCEMLKCLYMSDDGVYNVEKGKFVMQITYKPQKIARFDPSTKLGRFLNLIF